MHVIADLHGGDLSNSEAIAEFREIKDRVLAEVRVYLFILVQVSIVTHSEKRVRHVHTRSCGGSINGAYCWQCLHKHLLNLYVYKHDYGSQTFDLFQNGINVISYYARELR